MWSRIILHQYEIWPHSTGETTQVGCRTSSGYLTAVTASLSETGMLSLYKPIQTNASPHHNGPTSVSVVFKDTAVDVTLSRPSPHPYTSVTRGNSEALLICATANSGDSIETAFQRFLFQLQNVSIPICDQRITKVHQRILVTDKILYKDTSIYPLS